MDTLKERGKTAILVTHDLSEAIAMSDRVILLNRNPGRIHRMFNIPENIRQVQPFMLVRSRGSTNCFMRSGAKCKRSGRSEAYDIKG